MEEEIQAESDEQFSLTLSELVICFFLFKCWKR